MSEDGQLGISQALLRLDQAVLELIAAQKPVSSILESLCLKVEENSSGMVCSVLLLDGQILRHGAAPSLPPSYVSAINGASIGPRAGSCGTAAYRCETVIVSDIASNPLWEDYRNLALSYGLRACWSVPLASQEGVVLGTFACYYREPRTPDARDLLTIEHAAHLACVAIQHGRTRSELLAAETRYRSLVERLPAITYMAEVGATGRWFFVSPQIETMLGYTPAEWMANSGLWMSRIHEDDREIALAAERRVQETGELFKADYRVLARDGSVRWFRDEGKILPGPTQENPVMQGVLYDITDYKRLEEQLRQAQKMEAVGQLAGGIAHDFNNLLMIIQAHAERIAEAPAGKQGVSADTEEIKNAVARASSLTQRLLAFSRKQIWDPQVLDVSSVLHDVGGMIRRLLAENIRLEIDLGPAVSPVRADRGQLEQALLNLMLNARDAMVNGGDLRIRAGNIHLDRPQTWSHGSIPPGDYVVLAISDTGVGMSPETQAHMFEPFFTTKGPDKGTGLGLSTVYGVVQQSRGAILVESEPGRGSNFKVFLPACQPDIRCEERGSAALSSTPGHETILLVEDLEAIREMVSDHLRQLGYNVYTAPDGEAAMGLLNSQCRPIDLLISDMVMPNMGGRELARHLAKIHPKAKVLFISGYPEGICSTKAARNSSPAGMSTPA